MTRTASFTTAGRSASATSATRVEFSAAPRVAHDRSAGNRIGARSLESPRILKKSMINDRCLALERPVFCFHESFSGQAADFEMVADVWYPRPVRGIALHRNNCSFENICPRDNERIRVESALQKLATLNDLLEMPLSENSVDDMCFIGVWCRENFSIVTCPITQRRDTMILNLAPDFTGGRDSIVRHQLVKPPPKRRESVPVVAIE